MIIQVYSFFPFMLIFYFCYIYLTTINQYYFFLGKKKLTLFYIHWTITKKSYRLYGKIVFISQTLKGIAKIVELNQKKKISNCIYILYLLVFFFFFFFLYAFLKILKYYLIKFIYSWILTIIFNIAFLQVSSILIIIFLIFFLFNFTKKKKIKK